jgi:hypothetical protein
MTGAKERLVPLLRKMAQTLPERAKRGRLLKEAAEALVYLEGERVKAAAGAVLAKAARRTGRPLETVKAAALNKRAVAEKSYLPWLLGAAAVPTAVSALRGGLGGGGSVMEPGLSSWTDPTMWEMGGLDARSKSQLQRIMMREALRTGELSNALRAIRMTYGDQKTAGLRKLAKMMGPIDWAALEREIAANPPAYPRGALVSPGRGVPELPFAGGLPMAGGPAAGEIAPGAPAAGAPPAGGPPAGAPGAGGGGEPAAAAAAAAAAGAPKGKWYAPKGPWGGALVGAGAMLAAPYVHRMLFGPYGPGLLGGVDSQQFGGMDPASKANLARILAREAVRTNELYSTLGAIRQAYQPQMYGSMFSPGMMGRF